MIRLRGRKGGSEPDDINLAPLIDMTFLLLIFFMVTTSFSREAELQLERPGASTSDPSATHTIRVVVNVEGTIHVEGERTELYLLQARLRPMVRDEIHTHVVVVADRRLPTENLIEVVDQCRLAGAGHVAVAVEPVAP
jgi:biopolymer transport protein ExbD